MDKAAAVDMKTLKETVETKLLVQANKAYTAQAILQALHSAMPDDMADGDTQPRLLVAHVRDLIEAVADSLTDLSDEARCG